MTRRERMAILWTIDLIDDAMGASGEPDFCGRGRPAIRVLRRVIDVDPVLGRRQTADERYKRRISAAHTRAVRSR